MTNSITKELYLQLRDELTDKTSLPSKRQISLLVATKLVEFTETAYPAIGGNIQIRTNDKETYTEIGALLFTNCIQLNLHEIAMMQYKNYRIKLKQ